MKAVNGMNADVMIIGGGASGLMAAISCARAGRRVFVLERNARSGKKLLATGNGRCNFTNSRLDTGLYRGHDPSFSRSALAQFDQNAAVRFFEELGVLTRDDNGMMFPRTNQASSVLDALNCEARRLGIRFECGVKAEHVRFGEGVFEVCCSPCDERGRPREGSERCAGQAMTFKANRLILCCGGKASSVHGSDGSGYCLARELGHSVTPLVPALTGLKASESHCTALAGVRAEACVSLHVDGRYVMSDTGELQLTSYGVSGIPVFQLSRHAAMALLDGSDVVIKADFFPTMKRKELEKLLNVQKMRFQDAPTCDALSGMLNRSVLAVLLRLAQISPDGPFASSSGEQMADLSRLMKALPFTITGTNGFENAQLTAGGVDTGEVNPDTLESRIAKNLFFAGEMLDVDGPCGGYNLQWAWSSGFVAGSHAAK